MERIEVGMHVDIKRSDGRVHSSVVTELKPEKRVVMVEWFENGETKGKEIDINTLLLINPTLRKKEPKIDYKAPASHVQSFMEDENDENETLDDIKIPPRRNMPVRPEPTRLPPRRSHVFTSSGSASDVSNEPAPTQIMPSQSKSRLQPPRPGISRMQFTSGPSSTVSTPVELNRTLLAQSAEHIEADTTIVDNDHKAKGSTLQNVEKLQKDREERRAQQDRARKQKEMEKAVDPVIANNPFYSMIREFRANIDYRPLKMTDAVVDSRISVCVRKRPLNKKETTKKEIEVITIPNRDHLIVHQPQVKVDLTKFLENQKFRFDYAFDENTPNEMVYRFTAQPLVKTIFEKGFATCFAYGQTGSGKTHTMGGDFQGKNQNCSGGIYALTATDVFKTRNREFRNKKLQVFCCYFEIYGGKVFDLLNDKALLRVLEDGKKEVNVVGLKEEEVDNEEDVLDLIRRGTELRTAGATSANSNSSRSHAVFQIILKQYVQSSTCMIAMISPGMSSCEHTLNTLRYADRVKELGCDEGSGSTPMDDEEFMLPKEEDDDEEEDLTLICKRSGLQGSDLEKMKLQSKIEDSESQTLESHADLQHTLEGIVSKSRTLMASSRKSDYCFEDYCKNALMLKKEIIKSVEKFGDDLEKSMKLLQKEAELNSKPQTNGKRK
ncbi:unnamed protein product [Auanema sp. JU1783]|nr:unnamed protein product [Auanema sp. JU1783]